MKRLLLALAMLCVFPAVASAQHVTPGMYPSGFRPDLGQYIGRNGAIYQSRTNYTFVRTPYGYIIKYPLSYNNFRYNYPYTTYKGNVLYGPRYRTYRYIRYR
jgi:hypothetical protein